MIRWLAIATAACACCLLLLKLSSGSESRNDSSPHRLAEKVERHRQPPVHSGREMPKLGENQDQMEPEFQQESPLVVFDIPRTSGQIREYLNEVVRVLSKGDPEQSKIALDRLAAMLRGQPHDAAESIQAIVEFLATGKNGVTGESLIVGEGGALEEAPTLRVFLIDHLGFLGLESDKSAALESARQVLSIHGSADEWALSMRNVALLDAGSRTFLIECVTSMLSHQPWLEQPTIGMLEAFDLIVHAGSMEQVPALIGLLDHSDPAFWRASTVTLDRLASADPQAMASYLNSVPSILSDKPMIRADLFAKVDLAVPGQREEAELYLTRLDIRPEERSKFFSGLITSGRFVSHNLVTAPPPAEDQDEVIHRMDALLTTVNDWLADPRFSKFSNQLKLLEGKVRTIRQDIED